MGESEPQSLPSERRRGSDRIVGHEAAWVREDGRAIRLRLSGRAVRDKDSKLRYWEMFAEDITRQRELEAQLVHAQSSEPAGPA